MKLIDKIILFLLMLLLLAFGAGLIGMALHLIPMEMIANLLGILYLYQINSVILGAAGIVMIVLALRLIFAPKNGKRNQKTSAQPSALVQKGEGGASYISLSALDSMVKRHVSETRSVKDCEVGLNNTEEGLSIHLRLTVLPDTNIPELTGALQSSLKEYIETYSGIHVKEVVLFVSATEPVKTEAAAQ